MTSKRKKHAGRRTRRRALQPPYLALPSMYGDPVPPELRVFEAESEDALQHPYRVSAER